MLFNKLMLAGLVALITLSPAPLLACSVCYGSPDEPMTRGLTWAILALGGMIACVLVGVVAFFVHSQRKASALMQDTFPSAESVQRNA